MDPQERRSQAFWDRVADDEARGRIPGLLEADPRLSQYRDRAEQRVFFARTGELLGPDARLLEVGCGGGRWTVALARRVREVVATDIAPRMVERARERVEAEGLDNVTLAAGSLEALDYDGPFDVVYLGSCLHYVGDAALAEGMGRIAAAASDDCVLISRDTVSLIGRTFHRSELYGGDDPAIYRPIEAYEEVMARHGWKLASSWPTWVRPLSWRLRPLLPGPLLAAALRMEAPLAGAWVRLASMLERPRDKQHRFFVYRR